MTTYQNLISLRNNYNIEDPKFKELDKLITSYAKAAILAGEKYLANIIISDYGDLLDNGTYFEVPEIQEEYKEWMDWFRRWNFNHYAEKMEWWLKRYSHKE